MATYFVRSSGGSNGNDGLSFANAFATIDWAVNQGGTGNTALANGDEIRICDDATHTSSTTISIDTIAGGSSAPLIITGADSVGDVDGTRATVDFGGTTSGMDGFLMPSSSPTEGYIIFRHLRITGAAQHNVMMNGVNNAWYFDDCRIDTAGGAGVMNNIAGGNIHYHFLYRCEIDTNGAQGVGISNNNRIGPTMYYCSVHNNGSHGVQLGVGAGFGNLLFGCLIYRNGESGPGDGVHVNAMFATHSTQTLRIVNCTIDSNNGDGIYMGAPAAATIGVINTSLTHNTGFGVDCNGADPSRLTLFNSLFSSNSQGALSDGYTFASFPLSDGNLSDPPQYTSRDTPGSEDYEPQDTSPLIDAGQPG